MTTPKLYTATFDDQHTRVGQVGGDYFYWQEPRAGGTIYVTTAVKTTDLFALTEVTVVPKDAVVIEGVTRSELARFVGESIHEKGVAIQRWWDVYRRLHAQLTPSATTESEGGAGEATSSRKAKCWCGDVDCAINPTPKETIEGCNCKSEPHIFWCATLGNVEKSINSKPTPTVTIDMAKFEGDHGNALLKTLHDVRGNFGTRHMGFVTLSELISQIESQIPSRIKEPQNEVGKVCVTEPKDMSAVIKTNTGNTWARRHESNDEPWVGLNHSHTVFNSWRNLSGYSPVLIYSPTRVEGKE